MLDYESEIKQAREDWPLRGPSQLKILNKRAAFLTGTDGNVTSQFGEDGVFAALFKRIGIANGRCFEVGAKDGLDLSNTWILRETGWRALLIEADAVHFDTLKKNTRAGSSAVHETVTAKNINTVLAQIGETPDLGIIDIDGEDLKVWAAMTLCRPRVVLVEFNGRAEDGELWGGGPWQTGLNSTLILGETKGYVALATIGVNVLFLDSKEMWRLDSKEKHL